MLIQIQGQSSGQTSPQTRIAAQKVLETAISRVNPRLSRGVKYIENESKWDIGVGGRFAHELMFEIVMDTDGIMETIVDGIQKNWRYDPLLAELICKHGLRRFPHLVIIL